MTFKNPDETMAAVTEVGVGKANKRWDKILILGFMAGAYIGFGAFLSIIVSKNVGTWPAGISKLLAGCMFPVGLMLVVIQGAELFTSSTFVIIPAVLEGKATIQGMLKNWGLCYVSNFVGSVCCAYFLGYLSTLLHDEPYATATVHLAELKCHAGFGVNFLRGVGCNWLVNLAVFQANSSDDLVGKIFGIFFPILAFISIAFEHSVANMFYIPLGMMNGAELNAWDFIWGNLIPVTLGNIFSGSIIMGVGLWWCFVHGHDAPHHSLPNTVGHMHDGNTQMELTDVAKRPTKAT